jgi:isopentenyl-diphosphate Delta-isomerase
MGLEYLNIVDEDDNIIGQESREKIHSEGLLHREIHVYFITPDREVIFQHRAKDKDIYPDLLDATVGGHVDLGDTYQGAAIREIKEETGLNVTMDDLVFLNKTRKKASLDKATGKINNAWRESYIYNFKGELSDLKTEKGKALGFELWSLEKLKDISEEEKKRFIPYVVDFVLDNLIN